MEDQVVGLPVLPVVRRCHHARGTGRRRADVFSFLVVPAVIAFLFTRDMKRLAYISWGSGALASVLGLWLSLAGDLPTGPLIVCMYGIVLVGAIVLRKLIHARA